MANPYPAVFRDDNSDTRLAGSVDFTDPANQPGFTPVTVVATLATLDIHALAGHTFLIDGIVDNIEDFNTLTAIPAGLGLSFAFDGSSGTITTTTAGVWSLSASTPLAADATLAGGLLESFGGAISAFAPPSGNVGVALAVTYALPSGSAGHIAVETTVVATANPYDVSGTLSIVRLA